jgi:hypothetical protein
MYSKSNYINDLYGYCKLKPCKCLDPIKPRFGEWVGKLCPDWVPFEFVNNSNDLALNINKIRVIMEKQNE